MIGTKETQEISLVPSIMKEDMGLHSLFIMEGTAMS